jgi:hypothetical protein
VPTLAVHPEAGADWAGELAEEGFALAPAAAATLPEAVRVPIVDAPTLDTHLLWREGDERPLVADTVDAARACARARGWLDAA